MKSKKITATNSLQKATKRWGFLFMGPVLIAFFIGFIWPFIQGIWLSMCQFRLISDAKFIGFDNYVKTFQDASFRHAFWYTAMFAIVSLVFINVLAFIVAYILTLEIKGSNLFRTVFFMPNLIGGIVLGYIWSMIFDGILGRYQTSILLESKYGFWGLIILMCWQQIGYMMIIYIAGIQNVPGELIEAAMIDGASAKQRLRYVILPMLMPTISTCTFLTLTNGFKLFDQNLALTGGNPGKMSQLLALNIYDTMYGTTGWQGVGQAKAVIFFILVAVIAVLQNRLTTSKEVQG